MDFLNFEAIDGQCLKTLDGCNAVNITIGNISIENGRPSGGGMVHPAQATILYNEVDTYRAAYTKNPMLDLSMFFESVIGNIELHHVGESWFYGDDGTTKYVDTLIKYNSIYHSLAIGNIAVGSAFNHVEIVANYSNLYIQGFLFNEAGSAFGGAGNVMPLYLYTTYSGAGHIIIGNLGNGVLNPDKAKILFAGTYTAKELLNISKIVQGLSSWVLPSGGYIDSFSPIVLNTHHGVDVFFKLRFPYAVSLKCRFYTYNTNTTLITVKTYDASNTLLNTYTSVNKTYPDGYNLETVSIPTTNYSYATVTFSIDGQLDYIEVVEQ